ncbi:MAG: ABC transporter permease [Beijerinckiaceae bacterium]
MTSFSFKRFSALVHKEWIQMLRDPITLRFLVVLPIMQLFLFAYAINTNPKDLPSGVLSLDHSKYERSLIAALQNTGYYAVRSLSSVAESERMLARGDLLFVIEIPTNFDRSVDRGEQPSVLIDADATDPTAIGYATAALPAISTALDRDLPPVRRAQAQTPTAAFQFVIHARYNPEQLSVINTVPGLVCLVLVFSTLFLTTLSITRERERGTMENLLAMPVRPLEVMLAKMIPYIFVGYVQVLLIITVSTLAFQLPIRGSLPLLLFALGLFISSNLALGITISTVSANQMQATQMAQFTLMPSILLSGFMFPFAGMPIWAQWIGQVFPTTHTIRIVRGILLKGNGLPDIWPELWPTALFTIIAIVIAVRFYRETLD